MANNQQNPDQNLEDIAQSIPEAHGEGNTYQSMATMSDAELLAQVGTGPDPLSGRVQTSHAEPQMPLTRRPIPPDQLKKMHVVPSMSMTADPKFANNPFQLGDSVYHKTAKKEGIVKDTAASGRVQIQIGKEKFWVLPQNLVKL